MELVVQELIVRLERLDRSVRENVDRISDVVQEVSVKLDNVAKSTSRLEGVLARHIADDEQWRTEVSGRFRRLETAIQETEERLSAKTSAALETANAAIESGRSTGRRLAMALVVATVIGAITGLSVTCLDSSFIQLRPISAADVSSQ